MAKRDVAAEAREHFGRFSKFRQAFTRPTKLSATDDGWLFWLQGSDMSLQGFDLNQPEMAPVNVLAVEKRTTKLSKEEELLAQRLRSTVTSGVSGYKALDKDTIFYSANGTYFLSQSGSSVNLFDSLEEGQVKPTGATMDFQHNPANPFQVAFTADNNLYVMTITGGQEGGKIQTTIKTMTTIGKDEFPCAVADYIIQEEFERFTGYNWSPNGESILYTVTDTSQARELSLVNSANEAEKMRFSKVGDPNAVCVLLVVSVAHPETTPRKVLSQQLLWDCFSFEGSTAKGGPEYVPRFGWLTNGQIFLQLLDRVQETTHCISLDISRLPTVNPESTVDSNRHLYFKAIASTKDSNVSQLLWSSYRPDSWVDTCQQPIVLPSTTAQATEQKMLFLSRDDNDKQGGWQHIFAVQYDLDEQEKKPTTTQLTTGKFNVEDGSMRYDARSGLVYFVANSESNPLQKALYSFNLLDQLAKPEQSCVLQSTMGTHVESYINLRSKDGNVSVAFLAHQDNTPPELYVGGDQTKELGVVPTAPQLVQSGWFPFKDEVDTLPKPQCFTFDNREGQRLNGRVFLPKKKKEGGDDAKIPMMMYIYGGPHAQLINDGSFYCRCDALHNTLVELGIAVAVVDNRMAHSSNGQRTHKSCKLAMGSFETKDYVDAVAVIAGRFPVVDSTRVGIMGWSYGGYATLLAMAEASDVFKLGSSGAPVGDWRLYDTGYTERYMGLLTDPKAAEAYERSTIGAVAAGFPLELDRLIIAHGLLDENVHFSHTCHVLDAMVQHMKPYRLLAYPGQRHGMKPEARAHYNSLLCQAIVQYL